MRRRVSACLASLLFAAAAWGAPSNIVGFETGDSSTGGNDAECIILNSASITTATVRTGTRALRVNPTTTATGYGRVYGNFLASGQYDTGGTSVLSHRFYFRYATKPSADSEELMFIDLVTDFTLRLTSAGNLAAYSGGTTLLSTGATVLAADTWYRIQYRTNGTNAWSVTVDGAAELSGVDAFAGSSSVYLGKLVNRNGRTVDFFYDDYAASITDEAIGPGQIVRLAPTADGTYTAWTDGDGDATGNYTDVDDAPGDPAYDSLTSYVLSTTNTHAETVNVTDASTAGISGTINAVRSMTVHRRNDASATNIQHRIVSNGTAYDTTDVSTTNATWFQLGRCRSVDPFDSAAWTTSDIDGLQVGVEHNTSFTRELNFTMACIMVDFQPSTQSQAPRTMHQQRLRRQ